MSAISSAVPTSMTASPPVARRWHDAFIRMIWKETRVVLPFWLTVVGMIIAFGGLLLWLGKRELWLGQGETWRDGALAVTATMFSLLYALGCGAMSYANEREEGTWDLLRRVAASSSAVCAAKLLAGLCSSLLLAAISWTALLWLVPSLPQLTKMTQFSFLVFVSGIFVLSQTASVLTRSVLAALVLATLLGLPFGGFLVAIVESSPEYRYQEQVAEVQAQVQGALAAMVAAGCWLVSLQFWLARCWMLDVHPWQKIAWRWLLFPICEGGLWEHSPVAWQQQLGRLITREWLMTRVWLWTVVFAIAIPVVEYLQMHQYLQNGNRWSYAMLPLAGFCLVALMACPTLFGVWAYRHDQRGQRYRFLSDRGVSPGLVWVSKHLVRLPFVVAYVAFVFVVSVMFGRQNIFDIFAYFMIWTRIAVMAYAVGQLVGQMIRSPIVSSFVACVCSGLLIGWSRCLGEIYIPSVFDWVLVAILLFVSWFRSRDWMEERNTAAAWGRFTASLLIPFALFYAGIGWYRLSGVPKVTRAAPAASELPPLEQRQAGAQRIGKATYRKILEVYELERTAMVKNLKTSAFEQSVACGEQMDQLLRGEYLKRNHAGLLWELIERKGSKQWPLAEPVLRELHDRHFAETRRLFRQATREPNLIWPDEMLLDYSRNPDFKPLSYLLALAADEAAHAGRWEDSLEDSLCVWRFSRQISRRPPDYKWSWSNHGIQLADSQLVQHAENCRSPELIRRVIRELSAVESAWPSLSDDVREEWSEIDELRVDPNLAMIVDRLFPWERSRTLREVNALFAARLAICEAIDAVVQKGQADRIQLVAAAPHVDSRPANSPSTLKPAQQSTDQVVLTPEELLLQRTQPLFQQTLFVSFSNKASPPINEILRREVWHRSLIQCLALIAWRHEHGQLPDRLEDLVGTYLERLPLDPLTGKPFVLVKTLAELKQWVPDTQWAPQHAASLERMLPIIFSPSSEMRGALRVTRPDGRGEMWIDFDSASNFMGLRSLPPHE